MIIDRLVGGYWFMSIVLWWDGLWLVGLLIGWLVGWLMMVDWLIDECCRWWMMVVDDWYVMMVVNRVWCLFVGEGCLMMIECWWLLSVIMIVLVFADGRCLIYVGWLLTFWLIVWCFIRMVMVNDWFWLVGGDILIDDWFVMIDWWWFVKFVWWWLNVDGDDCDYDWVMINGIWWWLVGFWMVVGWVLVGCWLVVGWLMVVVRWWVTVFAYNWFVMIGWWWLVGGLVDWLCGWLLGLWWWLLLMMVMKIDDDLLMMVVLWGCWWLLLIGGCDWWFCGWLIDWLIADWLIDDDWLVKIGWDAWLSDWLVDVMMVTTIMITDGDGDVDSWWLVMLLMISGGCMMMSDRCLYDWYIDG